MGGSFKNGSGSANRYGSQFSVDYGVNYRQAFDNGHFNNFSTFLIQTSSLSKPTNISALTSKVDAALVKVNTPSSSIFAFIALLWLTSSSIIRRPEYRASN
jgi:hypothetical protein